MKEDIERPVVTDVAMAAVDIDPVGMLTVGMFTVGMVRTEDTGDCVLVPDNITS